MPLLSICEHTSRLAVTTRDGYLRPGFASAGGSDGPSATAHSLRNNVSEHIQLTWTNVPFDGRGFSVARRSAPRWLGFETTITAVQMKSVRVTDRSSRVRLAMGCVVPTAVLSVQSVRITRPLA